MTTEVIEISKIQIDYDVYPREEVDNNQVNLYRQNLNELPPIQLTKDDFILIDGMHRLRAHEIEGKTTIKAEIEELTKSDILTEAIRRNAKHGKQLSMTDKKRLVIKYYEENGNTKLNLAELFAVGKSIIYEWTSDLRKNEKEDRNKEIIELYLRCKSYREIANKLKIGKTTVERVIDVSQNSISGKMGHPESYQISDVWKFNSLDPQYGTSGYPGSIPGQVLENFLYYFSSPFDLIVDPMVGGGTTLDVAKKMYRRYLGYDLHPLKTREDIQFNDLRNGYPKEATNCDLIYLDPPYWHMMKYKEDTGIQLSREDFIKFIEIIARESYNTVKDGGFVGFIFEDVMEPVTKLYKGQNGEKMLSAHHLSPLFFEAGFELVWNIDVPLTLGQYTAMKTALAKEQKKMLHIKRDFLIWRK